MSGNVNKSILIGRLGKDPESKALPNGTSLSIFSVATSEKWKDQQGQQREETQWHRVVIYGKLADLANQYLHKGSSVYLEGKMVHRKWQDQQGKENTITEVVLDQRNGVMQFLDSKNQNQQQGYSQPQQGQQYQQNNQQNHQQNNQQNNNQQGGYQQYPQSGQY